MQVFGKAVLLTALALGGCAADRQQLRMTAALDPAIGTSVASYVALHGPFLSQVEVLEHEDVFRWVQPGHTTDISPRGYGLVFTQPRQLSCTVLLTAHAEKPSPELKDFQITKYQWEGDC